MSPWWGEIFECTKVKILSSIFAGYTLKLIGVWLNSASLEQLYLVIPKGLHHMLLVHNVIVNLDRLVQVFGIAIFDLDVQVHFPVGVSLWLFGFKRWLNHYFRLLHHLALFLVYLVYLLWKIEFGLWALVLRFFKLSHWSLSHLARHFVILRVIWLFHGRCKVEWDNFWLTWVTSINAKVELALVLKVLRLTRLFIFFLSLELVEKYFLLRAGQIGVFLLKSWGI